MRNRLYFALILTTAPSLLVGACSHASPATKKEAGVDATLYEDANDASDAGFDEPEPPYVRPDVHRVLHLGDSTVGFAGGMTKALRPRFVDAGIKYYSDSFTAAGIQSYDDDKDKRLQVLIKAFKPDMVIINMGMNNLTVPHPEVLVDHIQSIVKKISPRVCYWVGPPSWKPDRKLLVPVLRDHTAPCIFFNSSDLVLERQKDKVHPTDRGGEVWAEHFWHFFDTGKIEDDDGGAN